jgi:peptide/nickel transport system substrate-binding protein
MGPEGVRHKNGSALAIRLISAYPNASAVKPLPELLQQMFRAIGVRLDITEVEDGELYYSGYADQGQGDLFLELAGSGNSDPTYLLQNIFHSKAPWRFYRYIAPGKDVDTLIDAARQDSSLLAAVGRIREAHRLIIDEYIAAIPILMAPVFVLSQPDLELDMKENLDWIQFGNARLRT